MFVIDDLLLRSLGFTLKPFDMLWLIELMRDYGLKEKYPLKQIRNQIKENRLLFELGEVSESEYKEKHQVLLKKLEIAKEINENLSRDVQIQEAS